MARSLKQAIYGFSQSTAPVDLQNNFYDFIADLPLAL